MNTFQYKKLVFIINPRAGMKKKEDFLINVLNIFEDYEYSTEIHFTRAQGDGKKHVLNYGRDADLLVCMGGDGTLHEVVEGIIEAGLITPLGYIPAGSTNDFAVSLQLPMDPEVAAANIVKNIPRTIDVGRFNGNYFIYTASCGIFTRTSYDTPQDFKNLFGHFAYVLTGVRDLANVKKLKLTFETDKETVSGEYIFVAICNATSIGGIMTIDKENVDFSDGKFELILIKFPKDLIELGTIIKNLQTQNYDGDLIKLLPVSRMRIEDSTDVDWSLDGEKQEGTKLIDFEVFHNAIRFIY